MDIDVHRRPKFIVVTGGPGAGKTAVLEVVRRHFCEHVAVLPEAAGIVFGGGFPRTSTDAGRRAAQRAIFHVQRELECMFDEQGQAEIVLCDRGTLDGVAYWPGNVSDFFHDVGTSLEAELGRYAMVIHLRTPPADGGYNHKNPLRIESASDAARIDARIGDIWSNHPRRIVVENSTRFFDKLHRVLELLRAEMPACCHTQPPALAPNLVRESVMQ